ncbi:MAG: cytochrome D ubiquinol oxidase subunit II, partial [Verrucomicrobia bacterium]|nr:cytochrome D ubiquinol oxidase subunit II [Verrucomicrobiota bacterium]
MPKSKKRPCIQETDFTAGTVSHLSRVKSSTGNEDLDRRIAELVRDSGCTRRPDLIEEIVITALQIGSDDLGTGDLKLMNRSLREMREANVVFNPYTATRKISIFGSARTHPDKPEYQAAELFGRRIAAEGFMTITGAGEGIMGAAQKGGG